MKDTKHSQSEPASAAEWECLRRENAALRASTEQLDLALRAARMGVWDCEIATGRVVWAGEHARLFGIRPADFGGTLADIQNCVHPDDRERGMAVFRHTVADGAEFDNIYRVVWPDGGIHWLHSLGRLMRDANGAPHRIVGVTWDITAQRQAERQMEALSAVVRHSDAIMVIKDLDLRVIAANPTFARLAGYASEADLIGKTDAEIFQVAPDTEPVRSYMADERAAQQLPPGAALLREEPVLTPDGRTLCYLTKKYPIYDAANRLIATANISVDITERQTLERQLREANAEARALAARAESASRAKSAFLANMSHEIRTPLNAVLGFCHLLAQRPLDPGIQDLVRKIRAAGQTLLTLVNDILDFSRIEAGRLEIESAPFRLVEQLDSLAAIATAAIGAKPLELRVIPPAPDLDGLIGDGPRLQQVLLNLLANAIKFTDRGVIELRVESVSATATQAALRFAVSDTGIGIAPAQQREIFAAFTQADVSINRRFGGTGLGLAISRQLVQLMGGELMVESAPGVGSTFTFTLPLRRDPRAAARAPVGTGGGSAMSQHLAGIRLLVVDDSEINREVALGILETEGAWVALADDGQSALDWLHAHPDGVDLVLMDVQMPRLDGYAATRRLRQDPRWQRLPIVALTAGASQATQEAARAAGMNDFITKPFEVSQLIRCIQVWTGRQPV